MRNLIIQKDLEDVKALGVLKDGFRISSTGTDDDLAIDIQDAMGQDESLSLVTNNIIVTVEGEIVTLTGEVNRESEKITIGDIATIIAGDDNVNNFLRVINSQN